MIQRRLKKEDTPKLATAIKRFSKSCGKDKTKEVMDLFVGNVVYVLMTDNEETIQAIRIVNPDGDTVATIGDSIADNPEYKETPDGQSLIGGMEGGSANANYASHATDMTPLDDNGYADLARQTKGDEFESLDSDEFVPGYMLHDMSERSFGNVNSRHVGIGTSVPASAATSKAGAGSKLKIDTSKMPKPVVKIMKDDEKKQDAPKTTAVPIPSTQPEFTVPSGEIDPFDDMSPDFDSALFGEEEPYYFGSEGEVIEEDYDGFINFADKIDEQIRMQRDDLADAPDEPQWTPIPTIEAASQNATRKFGAEAAGLSNTSTFPVSEYVKRTADADDAFTAPQAETGSMKSALDCVAESKQRKGLGKLGIVLTILAVLLVACAGVFGAMVLNGDLFGSNPLFQREDASSSTADEPDYGAYVQVPASTMDRIQVVSGNTIYDVRQKLLDIGMVSAAKEIVQVANEMQANENIQAGSYIILGSDTPAGIMGRLVTGDLVPDGVIGVNEGDDLNDIAKAIDNAHVSFTGQDFLIAAKNYALFKDGYSMFSGIGGLPSVEGYIYSDEFNLNQVSNATDAIKLMLAPMQQWFVHEGVTPQEWLTMLTKASMIEKEAMFDEDRPLIASVIDNRLARNMQLQIDATVKYANGSEEARVMYEDLEVDSPYNTYKVQGLPIGPICSGIPQKDIDAVKNHADTEFLYYVLKDKDGHHEFCTTPDEFEAAKQRYLEIFGYSE